MDNNYKQTMPHSTAQSQPATSSSLPLIISLVMSIIAILEAVALTIVIVNTFKTDEYDYSDVEETLESAPASYTFDNNDEIIAFSLTCTAPDNSTITFTKNNEYSVLDQSSSLVGSGTYSIVRSSAVTLKNENGDTKSIYYDGTDIIDGTTFYECKENS